MAASAPFPADVQFALHEIGSKNKLTEASARKAAADFVGALRTLPNAEHMIVVGGYDEDPRELWDIPEARDFVARFTYWALQADGRPPQEWNLTAPSMGVIAMCCGAGRITGKDSVTGAYMIQVGGKP